MSSGVICDKCNRAMYSDSRSDKNAYVTIGIYYNTGYSRLHLCKECYKEFIVEFLKTMKEWEFIEKFGDV